MEIYNFLREVASGWALVAMMAVFIGIVAFVLRPGSRALHDDIAQIPFRNDKPGE